MHGTAALTVYTAGDIGLKEFHDFDFHHWKEFSGHSTNTPSTDLNSYQVQL